LPSRKTSPEPRQSVSPQKAITILKRLIDETRVLPGEAWDSPKRSQWRDTALGALEHAGVSNSLLESFRASESFVFSGDTPDEEMRHQMNTALKGMTAVLHSAIEQLGWQVEDEEPNTKQTPALGLGVSVFISHSSKDAVLAEALVDLLRSALGLPANEIRCSSVDGYRLPVGVNTENKLREEVNAAKVVIGLVTPSSLASHYVMFELGARWGAGLFLAPLLAGVTPSDLSGPLALLSFVTVHALT
jgi:hypothetical protein